MKNKISSPPLSKFRRAGNMIFTAGQLPRGADGKIVDGDIGVQTRQVMEAVLRDAGADLTHVVKITAWLTDAQFMPQFDAVYREFFRQSFPARSTVISGLVAGDVEIEAVAWVE